MDGKSWDLLGGCLVIVYSFSFAIIIVEGHLLVLEAFAPVSWTEIKCHKFWFDL